MDPSTRQGRRNKKRRGELNLNFISKAISSSAIKIYIYSTACEWERIEEEQKTRTGIINKGTIERAAALASDETYVRYAISIWWWSRLQVIYVYLWISRDDTIAEFR